MDIRTKAKRAKVLAAITDDGWTIEQLQKLTQYAHAQNNVCFMRAMLRDGLVFSCWAKVDNAPKKVLYFKTMEGMHAFHDKYQAEMAAREKARVRARDKRRNEAAKARRAAGIELRKRMLAEARERRLAEEALARAERARIRAEERAAAKQARQTAQAEAAAARKAERERLRIAKAAVAGMSGKKQIALAQTLYCLRDKEGKKAKLRASNAPKVDPVIPEGLQVYREEPPKPRFYVDPATITGGFAALPPGVYAFEPSSCAARAAA